MLQQTNPKELTEPPIAKRADAANLMTSGGPSRV